MPVIVVPRFSARLRHHYLLIVLCFIQFTTGTSDSYTVNAAHSLLPCFSMYLPMNVGPNNVFVVCSYLLS